MTGLHHGEAILVHRVCEGVDLVNLFSVCLIFFEGFIAAELTDFWSNCTAVEMIVQNY